MKHNGSVLCKDKMLKDFKLHFAHEIDFVSKTTQLVEKREDLTSSLSFGQLTTIYNILLLLFALVLY